MNTDELKTQAAKHAPTAGIVAAGAVVMHLLSGSAPQREQLNAVIDAAPGSAAQVQPPAPGDRVRVVSCGDGRDHVFLSADADDRHGTIALGTGAGGRCTLLFAGQHHGVCAVIGGRAVKLTATDLVIEGAADRVTYRCGE